MAKKRTPKIEKLLTHMKKEGGLTHKEIVKYLLKQAKLPYTDQTRKYFDSTLYGTNYKVGVLELYCRQLKNGRYKVSEKIEGPYTATRPAWDTPALDSESQGW